MVSGTSEPSSVSLVISGLLALIQWDTAGHVPWRCRNDPQDDYWIHRLTYCAVYLLQVWAREKKHKGLLSVRLVAAWKAVFMMMHLCVYVWSALRPRINSCSYILLRLYSHVSPGLFASPLFTPSVWKLQDTNFSTHGLLWESCFRPLMETLSSVSY